MAEPQRGAGAPQWPLSPYQINVQPAASGSTASGGLASTGIARGDRADWFGPLNPLTPIAPPEVAGRRFDFPVGYNLVVRPRAYEPIGFHELRGFADAYDLLRLVIETRKDQMERQRWRIRPRDPKFKRKSAAIDADMSARIAAAEKFLHKPDGITRWKTWLRALLEDMFVIDAATLYCQRTRAGELVALQQLDGATIKRLIDDWGRTPQPYAGSDGATIYPPAYQQVLKGLPAVNYAARDIIYRPRNVRAHRVYGYSPVQQILMTVNIALRRQLWQLDYYAEGSIPDALIGVPQGWTPDQIKQFQDYWDQEFSGDLARRRRAKFVPGEAAARVHQTKEPEQKNDFDEWLARIVCFAFSVPPQWAVKAMNRATADNQSAQAEEEGLEPTKEWVKDLIDEILAEELGSPDLELTWLDEDTDEKTEQAQFEARVKIGAATLNELRDALGLDPFDTPAADRPMVLTATGYVPIEANVGGQARGTQDLPPNDKGSSTNAIRSDAPPNGKVAPLVQKYSPDQPRVPAGNSGGGQWTTENVDNASPPHNAHEILGPSRPSDAVQNTKQPERQSDEGRVVSDATPWIPGAQYAANDLYPAISLKSPQPDGSGLRSENNSSAEGDNSLGAVPVADFSGGAHGALVDAFMALFKRQGFPAITEVPISLVGSAGVFGRLDILAKLPICIAVCAFEMKTGIDPSFTENQRDYIPLLRLGGHVYSTDPRIQGLGLLPGLPFPPMHVFVVWSVPLEPGYRVWEMPPKKPNQP
jgi:Phage portal protein